MDKNLGRGEKARSMVLLLMREARSTFHVDLDLLLVGELFGSGPAAPATR